MAKTKDQHIGKTFTKVFCFKPFAKLLLGPGNVYSQHNMSITDGNIYSQETNG